MSDLPLHQRDLHLRPQRQYTCTHAKCGVITRTETVNSVLITYTQNFDAENRLTSVIPNSGTATSFKYDGDGNLVAKLVGTVTTYYIGGVYEVQTTTNNSVVTIDKKTWYYPAGGALRVEDSVTPANSGVFYAKHSRIILAPPVSP